MCSGGCLGIPSPPSFLGLVVGQSLWLFGVSSDFRWHARPRELCVVEGLILLCSFKECWASLRRRATVLARRCNPFQVCREAFVGVP